MSNLETKLRALRLSSIVDVLHVRNQEAIHAKLAYIDFLELLVDDELTRRKGKLVERRKQLARFPSFKTLDDFNWEFNSKINRRQIMDLATCHFVPAGENILLLGHPGVGKSHLAIAIGLHAIRHAHSVRYYNAFEFVAALTAAELGGTRAQLLSELSRIDLIIIDELGMKKLPPSAGEDLLEIIMQRYEKGAMILTSNRPMEDWGKMLGDNATATAILDRLLHHAHIINITGKSYRIENRTTLQTKAGNK